MKSPSLALLAVGALLVAAPAWAQQQPASAFTPNRQVILTVEEHLAALGYPVEVDGATDANLRNNVLRYQSERGLRPTGEIDLATVDSLGIELEPIGGPPTTTAMAPPPVVVAPVEQTAQLPPDFGSPMLRNEHMSAPQIPNAGTPIENDVGLAVDPEDLPTPSELLAGERPPGFPPDFPVQSLYQ